MEPTATLALIGLALALLVVSLLCLYKVRKLHIATFGLVRDLSATRREVDALYAQLEARAALDRVLALPEPLPPTRGWAGSPDFLLALAEDVRARRPRTVVECSSGVSTLVIARMLQRVGQGHVYSLEHDPEYAARTRALVERHGLSAWSTVVDAPLSGAGAPTPWYSLDRLPDAGPIDLLVVDGPPEAVGPLARAPALDRLGPRLAARCAIVVDDADRPDETEMLRRWTLADPTLRVRRVPAEKGLAILERGPARTA